jgi:hypothetical protein
MSIKSYTFIPYRLQDLKVRSWEKKIAQGIQQSFGGQKNQFLEQVWTKGLRILVPRLVRYM